MAYKGSDKQASNTKRRTSESHDSVHKKSKTDELDDFEAEAEFISEYPLPTTPHKSSSPKPKFTVNLLKPPSSSPSFSSSSVGPFTTSSTPYPPFVFPPTPINTNNNNNNNNSTNNIRFNNVNNTSNKNSNANSNNNNNINKNSPPIPLRPPPTTTDSCKPSPPSFTFHSGTSSAYTDSLPPFSPEDSVMKIVPDVKYQDLLYASAVYTIRQFAEANRYGIKHEKKYEKEVGDVARRIVSRSIIAPPVVEPLPAIWVYHYVGEAVYQQIKTETLLKSAFVLYSEYLDCPFETRMFHPWVRVYRAYVQDAAKWVLPKKRSNQITDLDVYSFLVWRAAPSFAQYDCTAGPKAIYFNWEPMPKDLRDASLAADEIVAQDTKDESVADRYARVIKINLTGVVNYCQGKIFSVEPTNKNKWNESSLLQCISMKGREDLWRNYAPGGPYFQNVPHGCVVTPLGQIPAEYLEFDTPTPSTTTNTTATANTNNSSSVFANISNTYNVNNNNTNTNVNNNNTNTNVNNYNYNNVLADLGQFPDAVLQYNWDEEEEYDPTSPNFEMYTNDNEANNNAEYDPISPGFEFTTDTEEEKDNKEKSAEDNKKDSCDYIDLTSDFFFM